MLANNTLLVLSSIGLPPFASTSLTQTYESISAAKVMDRAVDGTLLDLSAPQLRKYKSQITGKDIDPPALDGIFPGRVTVVVDCIFEFSYLTLGGTPARTVVPGSSRVSGTFTFYRPRLSMRIVDFNVTTDEWGAIVDWRLDLEEE